MSTLSRTLANQALDTMFRSNLSTVGAQNQVGLTYARQIREQGEVSEQVIMDTTVAAAGQARNDYSKLGVYNAGLSAVGQGIQGSLPRNLARIGKNAVHNNNVRNVDDQNAIATTFTRSVAREATSDLERIVAQTGVDAAGQVGNPYSKIGCFNASLSALSQGVTGPVGATLAQLGHDSMHNSNVNNVGDQVAIGRSYAQALVAVTRDENERNVAQAARDAVGFCTSSYSQLGCLNASFSAIASGVGGAIGPVLARLAKASMFNNNIRTVEDQVGIGKAIGRRLSEQTSDSSERLIVQTALEASGNTSSSYSKLGVQNAAFDAIAKGISNPESGLRGVALNAIYNQNIKTIQDQNQIGRVFARALRDNTSDASVRIRAEAALEAAGNLSDPKGKLHLYDSLFRG